MAKKKLTNTVRLYETVFVREPYLSNLRKWLNVEHSGNEWAPNDVSDSLLEAHYAINRGNCFSMVGKLQKDGSIVLNAVSMCGKTYTLKEKKGKAT